MVKEKPQEVKKEDKHIWGYLIAISLLIIAIVTNLLQQTPQEQIGYSIRKESISNITWSPTKPFAEEIALKREPVVLRNTVVETWKALKKWSPEYIARSIHKRLRVNKNSKNIFVYFDKKNAMASLEEIKWHAPSEEVMMQADEFLKKATARANESKEFVYFSGSFDDLGLIKDEVEPSEWLTLRLANSKAKPVQMFWMGGGGVTAHTHYDSLHNYFVQIYGHKTFILSPPSAFESLYLYPSLHPSARQSQVDFVAPDLNKFPKFKNIPAISVTLGPGDVLYLPPFWFHRVIAEDLSISVSTWCDSEEIELYYDHIQETPLPFEENWSKEQNAVALKVFINTLLSELDRNATFVQKLVEQRYVSIFGRNKEENHACKLDEEFLSPFLSKFKTRAQEISVNFSKMKKFTKGESVLEIILSNYIEAMGDFLLETKDVNNFLQSCF